MTISMLSLPVLNHPQRQPARNRSAVPDLLFEDQQQDRIDEIRHLLEIPEAVTGSDPLHRLTVFLTYRCNLACPYCKTIARSPEELQARPEKNLTYDIGAFQELLATHAGTPIRHLHFTGGEASLLAILPTLIQMARAGGVEKISITTNGALEPERYLRLVQSGIDEIRVSLDAADPALGEELTLRSGAWTRAVRTIETLAAARRAGAPFFLIINTVVGRANRHRLVEIVSWLLALGPDDIKLITEVDARDGLGAFPEAEPMLGRIDQLLAGHSPEAFPLLRRKLHTVFARDAIGLTGIDNGTERDWRCYIPLTERTVDRAYYYPCSVYLREGGEPLGHIDEPAEMQRRKSAAFVREGDCLTDPICQRYCLHCTREYNRRANEVRE